MSRSQKKSLHVGNGSWKSEKQEKKAWHSRMRSRQKTQLKNLSDETVDALIPVVENEAGPPWSMRKEGKHYWSNPSRQRIAQLHAMQKCQNPEERESYKERLLAKWRAK